MNESPVVVKGNVATDIRHVVTQDGLHIAKFRLASTRRHRDKRTGEWVDGNTSFFNVVTWRHLAQNVAASLRKGDPIVVAGTVEVQDWTADDGRSGRTVEIDAESVGHDLNRGLSTFRRVSRTREVTPREEQAWRALLPPEEDDEPEPDDAVVYGVDADDDEDDEDDEVIVDPVTGELRPEPIVAA